MTGRESLIAARFRTRLLGLFWLAQLAIWWPAMILWSKGRRKMSDVGPHTTPRRVTAAEADAFVETRLLWEILEELRRPNREQALRVALREIADAAEADSAVERMALEALA